MKVLKTKVPEVKFADCLSALKYMWHIKTQPYERIRKFIRNDKSLEITREICGEQRVEKIDFVISEMRFRKELARATRKALDEGRELRTFSVMGDDGVTYYFDNETFECIEFESARDAKPVPASAFETLRKYQKQLKELSLHALTSKTSILAERRRVQAGIALAAAVEAYKKSKSTN